MLSDGFTFWSGTIVCVCCTGIRADKVCVVGVGFETRQYSSFVWLHKLVSFCCTGNLADIAFDEFGSYSWSWSGS